MEDHTFDNVTRFLAAHIPRRGLWQIVMGTGLSLATVWLPEDADGKRKRRKKKRKRRRRPPLPRNAFGCVDVGQPCRGNHDNCCSGICQGGKPRPGKPDRSRCAAHNVGICQTGGSCLTEDAIQCAESGLCGVTTGGAAFCGDLLAADCVPCQRDPDCQGLFGPGAACVVCGSDVCPEAGTACFAVAV